MRISVLLFSLLLWFSSCSKKKAYITEEGSIFNTYYSIKYNFSHSLKPKIEKELALFDNSLNPFKPNSVISKVSNNQEVVADSFFIDVFKRSQQISTITDGLFDITLSPLINAWGFGFKNMDNVTSDVIDSLKQITGYNKISLTNGQVMKKDPRIQLNASAIAKGYSVDVIARLLESYGITDYLVEIGGEIRTKGVNAKNEKWHIGIDMPMDDSPGIERPLITVIEISGKAIATSGNYQSFYEKDGEKYAHTINPRTGYPSDNNTLSATVIADDCMTADAFATAFMFADTVLMKDIAQKEKLSYMLILSGNVDLRYRIIRSDDFNKYIAPQ